MTMMTMMTIWMKNKAAPHQTDSIDIGRLPSVIHPCNYHHDDDDDDGDLDGDDHDDSHNDVQCTWLIRSQNKNKSPKKKTPREAKSRELLVPNNHDYDDDHDHDDDFEEEQDHGQDGAIGSADRLLAIRH